MTDLDLSFLNPWRARVDAALAEILDDQSLESAVKGVPPRLLDAMRYCVLSPGKRLRPLLTLLSARACSNESDDVVWRLARPAALAVELLHTYSLVHDDLPTLDNDDLRRGRPSLHKAFDDATALLTGDALLTDAFALIATAQNNAGPQVRALATAAGSAGMCGGQYDDVQGSAKDIGSILSVHERKTGRLFVAACVTGGLAVSASDERLQALRTFATHFGIAFQIADDLLDALPVGADFNPGPPSLVDLVGKEEARRRAQSAADSAVAAAAAISTHFATLARFAVSRTS